MGTRIRFVDDKIEPSSWARGYEWLVVVLIVGIIVGSAGTFVILRFGGVF
jgi:hypothetical protein